MWFGLIFERQNKQNKAGKPQRNRMLKWIFLLFPLRWLMIRQKWGVVFSMQWITWKISGCRLIDLSSSRWHLNSHTFPHFQFMQTPLVLDNKQLKTQIYLSSRSFSKQTMRQSISLSFPTIGVCTDGSSWQNINVKWRVIVLLQFGFNFWMINDNFVFVRQCLLLTFVACVFPWTVCCFNLSNPHQPKFNQTLDPRSLNLIAQNDNKETANNGTN